jgi:hypothetical protein
MISHNISNDISVTGDIFMNNKLVATEDFVVNNIYSGIYSNSIQSDTITMTSAIDDIVSNMVLTPEAGKHIITFNSQCSIVPGNITQEAANDLDILYNQLVTMTPTTTYVAARVFGNGEILTAGVYYCVVAASTVGQLFLDANFDPTATFVFLVTGTLTTGVSSTVSLINGAKSANVFWVCQVAITLGATTIMPGTFISHAGAVTLGINCVIDGRLINFVGAVGITAGCSVTVPLDNTALLTLNIGLLSNMALFTKLGTVTNSTITNIIGDVGSNGGAITGFATSIIDGNIYNANDEYNAIATFSVYQNNLIIPNSVRIRKYFAKTEDITLYAIADINNTETIDVRANIDLGTLTLTNRIMISEKIGA